MPASPLLTQPILVGKNSASLTKRLDQGLNFWNMQKLKFQSMKEGLLVLANIVLHNKETMADRLLAKARVLKKMWDCTYNEALKDKLWHKVLYPARDVYAEIAKVSPSAEIYLKLAECYRLLPLHSSYQGEAVLAYAHAIALTTVPEEKGRIRETAIASFESDGTHSFNQALVLRSSGLRNELTYFAAACFISAAQLEQDPNKKSVLYEKALMAYVYYGEELNIYLALKTALLHSTCIEQAERMLALAIEKLKRINPEFAIIRDFISQLAILFPNGKIPQLYR